MKKVKKRINLANYITSTRFITTPIIFFLILGGYNFYAFIVYVIFALSDAADGFIAEISKKRTIFGGMLDALADRVYIATTVLALIITKLIPFWAVAILVCYVFAEFVLAKKIMHKFKIKNYLSFVHRNSIRCLAVLIFTAIGGYVLNHEETLPLANLIMIISVPVAIYTIIDYAMYIGKRKRSGLRKK